MREMNKKITIPSDLKSVKKVVAEILTCLKKQKADEADVFDIRLSLEEALINAIKYGNKQDEAAPVLIDFEYDDHKVGISIEDKGKGFDYERVPDPTKEDNLLKGSGRGVFLIRHLMDSVKYNKKGNRISMVKYLRSTNASKRTGQGS